MLLSSIRGLVQDGKITCLNVGMEVCKTQLARPTPYILHLSILE